MSEPGALIEDLDALEQQVWERLQAAVSSHRAAFHSGSVATAGRDGAPQLRTVILRAAEPAQRRLAFHTDRRSPKFAELAAEPRMSWLFYDDAARMQLRLDAIAQLHLDTPRADRHWAATTLDSRRAYAAINPPGSPLPEPGNGLPAEAADPRWTLAFSEEYRGNFAVVLAEVRQLDVLLLHHRGHRRARYAYADDDARRSAHWLIP